MKISRKALLAIAASATLLGACATGPYYDNYGYGYDGYADPYYGYPGYGYAAAPTVGFGIGFTEVHRDREWRGDRHDWRGERREWHGDRRGDWHRDGDRRGDWHRDGDRDHH